ncbi:MAG: tetratricopeptide repeat-containing sensor histidine kinase [Flammeovirgaceae bacterium]
MERTRVTTLTLGIALFFTTSLSTDLLGQCDCAIAKQTRKEISKNLRKNDLEAAKNLAQGLIDGENAACHVVGYRYMAAIFIDTHALDAAKAELDKALDVFLSDCDSSTWLALQVLYAQLYAKKTDYERAINLATEVLGIAEQQDDYLSQQRLLNIMATIFSRINQTDKALSYNLRNLKLTQAHQDTAAMLRMLANLSANYGTLYEKAGEHAEHYDSLKAKNQALLQLALKARDTSFIKNAYLITSGQYYLKGQHQKAILYADSALALDYLHPSKRRTPYIRKSAHDKKGFAYIGLADGKNARIAGDSALFYAQQIDGPVGIISAMEKQYAGERLMGNYKEALEIYVKLSELDDSLLSLNRSIRINELEQQYEKAKNENTIKELQQKQEIDGLQIKLLGVGIAFSVIGLIAVLLYFRQRNLKNKTRILQAEQRLNRSRMNPHFFFNVLAAIHAEMLSGKRKEETAEHLAQSTKIMRQSLESSYHDLISIEEEVAFLENYIALQKLLHGDKFEAHIHIDEVLDPTETLIPSMLTQPFVENAIAHGLNGLAQKGEIHIHFTEKNGKLEIGIDDNGKGLTSGSVVQFNHQSRALQITQDRIFLLGKMRQVKGLVEIEEKRQQQGVKAIIHVPLMYEAV